MKMPLQVTRMLSVLLLSLAALALGGRTALAQTATDPFPTGESVVEADFDGTVIQLFAYKPVTYHGEGFILLLHGASRTAESYRDNAVGMADDAGRLVVVPLFDQERFPEWRYQFGGVFRPDGSLAPPEERTFAFIPKIVSYIRAREGAPQMPYLLAGFSAGSQFVSRMTVFMDTDAERVIAMAGGSIVFPTRDMKFGLGFGGLPDELSNDERIKRYLALPMTVYIGTADTATAQLPQGEAYEQGVHRYSRNIRWFNEAMDLAYEKQWPFNWRLVIADGPGHSPRDMFHNSQIQNALFGHRPK